MPAALSLDDDLQMQDEYLSMPSISSYPERPPRPTGNRKLSKKEWEDLKPTIKHLYVDQNQTLKYLAGWIHHHHHAMPS